MNKKMRSLLAVVFLVCLDLHCSMAISFKEVFDRYCCIPLSAFIQQDQMIRPSASSLGNRAAATGLYFLATWMSLIVDRLRDDISEDEFVFNFIVQTFGWWIALGENLSHDRYRNFRMKPRNKFFAIAIICATADGSVFLKTLKALRSNGLKSFPSFDHIKWFFLRVLPQSTYILTFSSN